MSVLVALGTSAAYFYSVMATFFPDLIGSTHVITKVRRLSLLWVFRCYCARQRKTSKH